MKIKYHIKTTSMIFKASMLSLFRDPVALTFSTLFPLLFVFAFGFFNSDNLTLKILIRATSDTTNIIHSELKRIPNIEIYYEKENSGNAHRKLETGEYDAILNLTEFSNNMLLVNLETTAAKPQEGKTLEIVLENIVKKHNLQDANSQAAININRIQYSVDIVDGREYTSIDFLLPGQLSFALMNTGIFTTALFFVSLKETGVLKRLFATPVSKFSIIVGESLSRLLFGVMQTALILGIGVIAFNFVLVGGITTFLNLIFISILSLIAFSGIGFLISTFVKRERSAVPIIIIVMLPQLLLSGTFFKLEVFPKWIQTLSTIFPLTHTNNALRDISYNGSSLMENASDIGVLLFFILILYTSAVVFFKWE